jgi:NIMA-interacting peptidyl-prolyl cis-trans isomerase 1
VAIDGQRIPPQKPIHLKDGARLTLGPRTWTLRASPAPAPAAAAAAAAPPAGPTHVRASHLLVKHAGSRRPSSWKEASVTRSEADALAMIQAFHKALAAGGAAEFAELARRESHCSSARSGGDLGEFGRGQMQRAFEEAAFGLAVGELSGPVHTDSGVHLIYRTA